jgi:hypothetical protein
MKDDIQIELARSLEKAAAETSHRAPVMEQDLEAPEPEPETDPVTLEEDVSATDIRRDIQAVRQALAMAKLGDFKWIARAGDGVDRLERHFDSLMKSEKNVSLA